MVNNWKNWNFHFLFLGCKYWIFYLILKYLKYNYYNMGGAMPHIYRSATFLSYAYITKKLT